VISRTSEILFQEIYTSILNYKLIRTRKRIYVYMCIYANRNLCLNVLPTWKLTSSLATFGIHEKICIIKSLLSEWISFNSIGRFRLRELTLAHVDHPWSPPAPGCAWLCWSSWARVYLRWTWTPSRWWNCRDRALVPVPVLVRSTSRIRAAYRVG